MMKRVRRVRLDPIFASTSYRCRYCHRDLLADVDLFVGKVRDHFHPASLGGADGDANRVPSCAACDRLKGSRQFGTVEEAREFLAAQRAGWQRRVEQIRLAIGGQSDG